MGLFGKAKRELGLADKKLIATGILARGNIVSCTPGGMTIGDDSNLRYGSDAYEATCRHSIPLIYIPKMQEQGAAVAVRVDPKDPQRIELDLALEAPPAPIIAVSDDGTRQKVTTSKSTYTAAEILQRGAACTVDVLAVVPLNQLASDGSHATGLVLMVHRDGMPGYQAQIGTHIPDAAIARVVVGATLPAKWFRAPGCARRRCGTSRAQRSATRKPCLGCAQCPRNPQTSSRISRRPARCGPRSTWGTRCSPRARRPHRAA